MQRIVFIFLILSLSLTSLQAQSGHEKDQPKVHKKEIAASKLPSKVTRYISANLPNASITKATKQRRNPDAKFEVHVVIKARHHNLVFNKAGDLVKLDGKRVYTSAGGN